MSGNTCYVEQFRYLMKAYGQTISATTTPGSRFELESYGTDDVSAAFSKPEYITRDAAGGTLKRAHRRGERLRVRRE